MKTYIETKRTLLRELTLNDLENLFDLDSDVEVMKYLTFGIPSKRDEIQRHLEKMTQLHKLHQGKFGYWAVVEKETNEFMGWFHFRPDKKEPLNTKRIELGYRLKKKFGGKGYATEVSKALVLKGLKVYRLDEVFAITMQENLASRKVMEKTGLEYIKTYIDDDCFSTPVKMVLYQLKNNTDKKEH